MALTNITVIGLGEAGRLYAEGLAANGATVRGYDPFLSVASDSFTQHASLESALDGTDIALCLVGARAAATVAADVAAAAPHPFVYADLNSTSPELKLAIGVTTADRGLLPCDVAVMAPVPRAGHRTPLLVSGPGADRCADLLTPLGSPVEVIGADMGAAAQVKLLRSVFMKGLATLVIETLNAAELAGQRERLTEQVAAELGPNGAALVERLVTGTYAHAGRREHEMLDALAELQRIGAAHDMTDATIATFRRILSEQ